MKSILFFSHKKTAENYSMINKLKLQFLNNLWNQECKTHLFEFVLTRALFSYIIQVHCINFQKTFDIAIVSQRGGPHLQLHEALCYVGNARYMEVYVDLEGEDPRKFCCCCNGQRNICCVCLLCLRTLLIMRGKNNRPMGTL